MPYKNLKINKETIQLRSKLQNKGEAKELWLVRIFNQKSEGRLILVETSLVSNHHKRQSKRPTLSLQTLILKWDQTSLKAKTANLSSKTPLKVRVVLVDRWRDLSISQLYLEAVSKLSISGREMKKRNSLSFFRFMVEIGKWLQSSCQDVHPNNVATISKTTSTNSI